ncbi:MAG: ATP-dependent helicase [Endomicrobiales bacterium]
MEDFLRKLNPTQREAVLHVDNPLIIFAGAGTGKTRVITYRIAYLLHQNISPMNILAVTFTNKAAEEMRRRVDELVPGRGRSVWISTFHSFCAQFLRVESKHIGLNPEYLIYDSADQKSVLRDCIKELTLDEKKFKPGRLLELISRAKDDLLDADSYGIHTLASGDYFRQVTATVYALYAKKLTQAGALDFGDLLLRTVLALRENEELREKYQERFRYLLVDEYQDTNHAQYMLTKYLSGKYKNICVVGDDDQSIYSWRGADIRNILEFERDYPGCRTVKLEQNYRSSTTILSAAWRVVKNNQKRVDKKLWTENPEGSAIKIFENANELEEAQRVVDEVELVRQKSSRPLNDFAAFYRTNAQSRVLEDAFRRAGIPYAVVGTVRFYERAEIKDIMAYLRLIHNPQDSVSFKRVINVPRRGIGKTTLGALEAFARENNLSLWEAAGRVASIELPRGAVRALAAFRLMIAGLRQGKDTRTVKDIAVETLDKTGYVRELEAEDTPEAKSRIENVHELVSAIDEFEQRSPDRTLAGYLTQVSLVNDLDEWKEDTDRVTMMTLHLAKGLEFSTVFLVGLEEGLFPIGEAAFDPTELEEERRLMYVGMTRAKENLYLSWAAERRIYGKSRWNMPSRFIQEASADGRAGTFRKEPRKEVFIQRAAFHKEEEDHVSSCQPDADKQDPEYPLGSRVRHAQFGEGKVIDKSGAGDDLKLVVLFDSGQWKKLIAKYANLEKL